jgi:hypothetical protein
MVHLKEMLPCGQVEGAGRVSRVSESVPSTTAHLAIVSFSSIAAVSCRNSAMENPLRCTSNVMSSRSNAAEKRIQPGEVIVEINLKPASRPADVTKKLKAPKHSGKKNALLFVAGLQGDVYFVAIPIE